MLVAVESLKKCFPSLPIAPNERRSMVATPCSYSTNIWKIVDGLVLFFVCGSSDSYASMTPSDLHAPAMFGKT